MLSESVILGAKTHANQMIDIICSVLITGRYAEIYEAQFMGVSDGKGTRIGTEREKRTGESSTKECKLTCWDEGYFHVALFKATAMPKAKPL